PDDYHRVDENGQTLYVSLERTNGNLGAAQATIGVNLFPAGPGAASANDFTLNDLLPTWNSTWNVTQRHSDAQTGPNFQLPRPAASDVRVTINNNTNLDGN